MKALPIVERELRVAARRPRTYRARWGTALVAGIFGAWLAWVFRRFGGPGVSTTQIFQHVAETLMMVCMFSGVNHTADCLSGEKREGTLGLLFLTDLKSYDIVLGKLLATSLNSIFGLLATVPVFSLALLMGGVQGWQLFQVALALLNGLFCSLAAGLFVSSWSRDQKRAANFAALLLILWWVGFTILSYKLRIRNAVGLAEFFSIMNPWNTIGFVFGAGTVPRFWWSLLSVHLVAWTFLGLACWILPGAWQDKPVGATGIPWRDRLQQWALGNPGTRLTFRQRLLDRNAFYWLAARDRWRPVATGLGIAAVLMGVTGLYWYLYPNFELIPACIVTSALLHGLLKFEFCSNAARQLAEERQTGTIELFLSTPLSIREILRGQWLALTRHYLKPVLAIIAVDLALIGLLALANPDLPKFSDDDLSWPQYVALLFGAATIMLFVDLAALGWFGMWSGLKARLPSHASGRAVLTVVIAPWVVLFMGLTTAGILRPPWFDDLKFWHFVGVWFVLGLATDVPAIIWARRQLHRHFRVVATQRFQPPKGKKGLFRTGRPVPSKAPGPLATMDS